MNTVTGLWKEQTADNVWKVWEATVGGEIKVYESCFKRIIAEEPAAL